MMMKVFTVQLVISGVRADMGWVGGFQMFLL